MGGGLANYFLLRSSLCELEKIRSMIHDLNYFFCTLQRGVMTSCKDNMTNVLEEESNPVDLIGNHSNVRLTPVARTLKCITFCRSLFHLDMMALHSNVIHHEYLWVLYH